MRLYQIFDRVASAIVGPIVVERVDGPAVRWFYQVLSEPKTGPGISPGDYDLLFLGEQELSGDLLISGRPEVVATGAGWLASRGAPGGE